MTWVRFLACITLDFRPSMIFILVVSLVSEELIGNNMLCQGFFSLLACFYLCVSHASEQTLYN